MHLPTGLAQESHRNLLMHVIPILTLQTIKLVRVFCTTDDVVPGLILGIHSAHHLLRPVATVLVKSSFVLEGPWIGQRINDNGPPYRQRLPP